jgi:hypothetical protein
MSLQAQRAVNTSRLEPSLRHIAQTLAVYADEHGANIRPGLRTVAQALGRQKRQVYRGLKALVDRQILIRTGYHHRTRCYRLDLARLAAFQPNDRCHVRHLSNRHSEAATGVMGDIRQVSCTTLSASPILISDLKTDLKKNRKEPTDAGASAPSPERAEPEDRNEERASNEGSANILISDVEPLPLDPEPLSDLIRADAPPFAVYARLAQLALQLAALERDDSFSNVAEHLKTLCAQHGQPYEAEIIRKAVDTAFVMRDRRAQATWTAAREIFAKPQPASTPHSRRARELAKAG